MYDLIIVGGGPAGLAAAVYAIRKRLQVLLVSKDLGGKTNYHMELPDSDVFYVIRGVEVVRRFRRELDYLDFARSLETVTAVSRDGADFTVRTAGGEEIRSRAVILATGARVRKLGVPGEEEFLGRGLTYSALSYASLFLDRTTVVVGEGRLALRAAAELAQVATTVHLVTPGRPDMSAPLAEKLSRTSNVVIWPAHQVRAIEGGGYVQRVLLQTPQGDDECIEADGVFIELGLIPNSDPVKGLVERDEEGRVRIDSVNRTSCSGLFAAGDVSTAYAEQVLIAIGEGVKAALSAYEYLLLADS